MGECNHHEISQYYYLHIHFQNETLLALPAPQHHPLKGSSSSKSRGSKVALGLVMRAPTETLIEGAHTFMEDLMRMLKALMYEVLKGGGGSQEANYLYIDIKLFQRITLQKY